MASLRPQTILDGRTIYVPSSFDRLIFSYNHPLLYALCGIAGHLLFVTLRVLRGSKN
jgi:hypothetical protein